MAIFSHLCNNGINIEVNNFLFELRPTTQEEPCIPPVSTKESISRQVIDQEDNLLLVFD